MKLEFSNNQFDKEGIRKNPEIEVKTFLLECNEEEFLDLYLRQLGITSRHLRFYKCILEFMDKGGGFTLKHLGKQLLERGFNMNVSQVYISELSHLKIAGTPVVKKVNNGVWKVPKDILFYGDTNEYRLYVVKENLKD